MADDASEPTVCRALRFLNPTLKRKSRAAYRKFERANLQRVADFKQWMLERDAASIIFVDEMGVRVADAQRIYARLKAGTEAAVQPAAHNTGQRGILRTFSPRLTSTVLWTAPSTSATPSTPPRLRIGSSSCSSRPSGKNIPSVVMDNTSFHRRGPLQLLFAEHGIELVFLPAYCPEFNPIETAFAWVKARIRNTPMDAMLDLPAVAHRDFEAGDGESGRCVDALQRVRLRGVRLRSVCVSIGNQLLRRGNAAAAKRVLYDYQSECNNGTSSILVYVVEPTSPSRSRERR